MPMVTVEFKDACTLNRNDGTQAYFPVGIQQIEEADANHYWVKHFLAKKPAPKLGEEAFARSARVYADQKYAAAQEAVQAYQEADDAAKAAEDAWQSKYAAGLQAAQAATSFTPGMTPNPTLDVAPRRPVLPPEGFTTTLPGADSLSGADTGVGADTMESGDILNGSDSAPGADSLTGGDTLKGADTGVGADSMDGGNRHPRARAKINN